MEALRILPWAEVRDKRLLGKYFGVEGFGQPEENDNQSEASDEEGEEKQ